MLSRKRGRRATTTHYYDDSFLTLSPRHTRKKSKHHRIKLDLTAAKASILRRASELLKSRKDSFAFADINCRLCAKLGSKFFYFEDERELHQHLKELDSIDLNESGKSEFETY